MKPVSPEIADDRQKIRDTMLRMLARREHSEQEMLLKMRQRGFNLALVKAEMADFQQRNWQNDVRFTEQFIRQRIARGQGEIRIRYELGLQHIDERVVNAVMHEQEVDWFELAKLVHDRRFSDSEPLAAKKKQQHLRHLQSRGFNSDQIRYACPCRFTRQ